MCDNRKQQANIFESYEPIQNKAMENTVTRARTQRCQGFGETSKCLTLRAWRLGGINFLDVVL